MEHLELGMLLGPEGTGARAGFGWLRVGCCLDRDRLLLTACPLGCGVGVGRWVA